MDYALGKKRLHRAGWRKVREKFVAKGLELRLVLARKNHVTGQ
jgi:hypothetical protein